MRQLTLILLLAGATAAAQEARKDSGVGVTLSDGSILVSPTGLEELGIRTPYGDQRIPLREIRAARRLPHGGFMVQARGLSVSGELLQKDFEVATSIGAFRVAGDEIRSISAISGPRALLDDATAALWWFPDTEGGICRDRVKGRPLTLQDQEWSLDPALKGIVRKKPLASGSAPGDEDIDFADEDYTLDVRFKVPALIRQYLMVLQKGNPADGSIDFNLSTAGNLTISAYSARNSGSFQTQTPVLKRDAWNTVTIVQKVQPPSTICYVNGRPVFNLPQLLPFGGGQRRAIHIGPAPRLNQGSEGPEAVQYVRLSRVARSPEEIADTERLLEGEASPAAAPRGVLLRDGTQLRGEFPGLTGSTFRTRFGPLTLSEKSGGQIQLYRMRRKELEEVQTGARDLVTRLGSSRIEERDAATAQITTLGEAAVDVLQESKGSVDPEIRSRILAILKKLEESGLAARPACDLLRLGDLTLHGWLEADPVAVSARRGCYRIPAGLIDRISLGRKDSRGRPLLRLHSGEILEFDPVDGAKALMETPFGKVVVPLEEFRSLRFHAEDGRWTLNAERLSATGKLSGTADLETELGTLTLPLSEARDLRSATKNGSSPLPLVNEDE